MPGEGDPVEFEVAEGANASSIGSDLAEQDIIRNGLAFRILARYRGRRRVLRAPGRTSSRPA